MRGAPLSATERKAANAEALDMNVVGHDADRIE
jgi:hypothetical protein